MATTALSPHQLERELYLELMGHPELEFHGLQVNLLDREVCLRGIVETHIEDVDLLLAAICTHVLGADPVIHDQLLVRHIN